MYPCRSERLPRIGSRKTSTSWRAFSLVGAQTPGPRPLQKPSCDTHGLVGIDALCGLRSVADGALRCGSLRLSAPTEEEEDTNIWRTMEEAVLPSQFLRQAGELLPKASNNVALSSGVSQE